MHINYLLELRDRTLLNSGTYNAFLRFIIEYLETKIDHDPTDVVSFNEFEIFLHTYYSSYPLLFLTEPEKILLQYKANTNNSDCDYELFSYYLFRPMPGMLEVPNIPFVPLLEVMAPEVQTQEAKILPVNNQCLPTYLSKSQADTWVNEFKAALASKDDSRIKASLDVANFDLWTYFIGEVAYFKDKTCRIEIGERVNHLEIALNSNSSIVHKYLQENIKVLKIAIKKIKYSDIKDSNVAWYQVILLRDRITALEAQPEEKPAVLQTDNPIEKTKVPLTSEGAGLNTEESQATTLPSREQKSANHSKRPHATERGLLSYDHGSKPSSTNTKKMRKLGAMGSWNLKKIQKKSPYLNENKAEHPVTDQVGTTHETSVTPSEEKSVVPQTDNPIEKSELRLVSETSLNMKAMRKTTAESESPPKRRKKVTWKTHASEEVFPNTWLQYVEYKSCLLAISNSENWYIQGIRFVKDSQFFEYNKKDHSYYTWLTWTNQRHLLVNMTEMDNDMLNVDFLCGNDLKKVLLEVKINLNKNKISISKHEPQQPWHDSDIDDIANDFYDFFPNAEFIYTPFLTGAPVNTGRLKKDEFVQAISYYKNHNITTRLQKILHPTISGPFVFWLNWNNNDLKVTVENSEFCSYVFSEKRLFEKYYPEEKFSRPLSYYRIKIFEIQQEKESGVIGFWTTVDGLVAELTQVNKGFTISGAQAFPIIKQFLRLIQPKDFFLQDLAHVWVNKPNANKKDRPIPLPLRLKYMLTDEQTWYQKNLNVNAVNADRWESGWNEKVSLTQCADTFYAAARDLRSLSFLSLLQYFKKQNRWLLSVAKKYFSDKASEQLTAKDIYTVIFNKENMEKPEGYADFQKLYGLLKWGIYYNELDRQDKSKKEINITNKTMIRTQIENSGDVNRRVKCIMATRFFKGSFKKTERAETKRDPMQVPDSSWKRMKPV